MDGGVGSAMTMGDDFEQLPGPPAPAGPSIAIFAGAMVGLTLIAVASGGVLGLRIAAVKRAEIQASTDAPPPPKVIAPYAADTNLRDLPPIIANLADPPDAWVRLQATLVLDGASTPKPEIVAAEIAEDILGFMRTVTLAQIAGASGLQHLREDLNERAAIRSNGRVRELILQTLVVQ
ncbi:flagellar basal body-associated FliL family protein [Methylocella tundrae]|uniref:flagellar basal body-associated FliL family protein n=1 Tax=Methylocella tundrae TaxID=227605 RepID=UPI0030FEA81C|nr:flagellar basal body-associated FliL family protein [Methylocella tundrae]